MLITGIKNATLLAAILAGSPRMTFKNPISYGVPQIDVLVASAARSERGDTLALKVVNFAPFGLKASIHISGMGRLRPTAKMVLLTGGNLNLDNTADQSDRIVPVAGQRDGIGPAFVHNFPAYSYTILDLREQP